MATSTTSLIPTVVSAAAAQTYYQGISNALAAVGMVKTSDTGQIDLTVTTWYAGTTTSGDYGYEIWKFPDALQSTAPLFIKVVYGGRFYSSAVCPRLSFQLGTATNGAGTLTGKVGQQQGYTYQYTRTAAANLYVSRTGGRLTIVMMSSPQAEFYLNIERSKDASGTETGNGANILYCWPLTGNGAVGGYYQQYLPILDVAAGPEVSIAPIHVMWKPIPSQTRGGNIPIYPIFPHFYGILNPLPGICYYPNSDISGAPVDISVTHYGVARNMKFLGPVTYSGDTGRGLAMIWE